MRFSGILQPIELICYDLYVGLQYDPGVRNDRIILVKITEGDIKALGHWPMTDGELAVLLDSVAADKPSAIGLDILRDIQVPPGKVMLEKVFRERANVFAIRKLGDDREPGVGGPYSLRDPERVGFNDIILDPDGAIRRGLLFLDDGKTVYSSLSLLLALQYLKNFKIVPEPDAREPTHMRLGKTTFTPLGEYDAAYAGIDARGYQYILDYKGPPFQSIMLDDLMKRKVPAGIFSNKIVIIGSTAVSLKDIFHTPINRFGASRDFQYGIEIHAFMASQLIRFALGESKPLRFFPESLEYVLIIVAGLLGGIFTLFTRKIWHFLLSGFCVLAIVAAVTFLAFLAGWWLPVIPVLMSCLASSGFITAYISTVERAERESMMQLFSKHVSASVAAELWKDRDKFMSGGRPSSQKFIATILFTDLKGFTSISEKLDPEVLIHWLNEYMEAMGSVIISHGGTINKYIGDSVMAIFGAPLKKELESHINADAMSAVLCALEMGDATLKLNAVWQKRGLPSAYTRIGIFTGPIVAGCLGSSERMEYTVIGDTVNIASRLEGFQKEGASASDDRSRPWRVLIGEATLKRLGGRFETVGIGAVSLKGKKDRLTVFEVISDAGNGIKEGRT